MKEAHRAQRASPSPANLTLPGPLPGPPAPRPGSGISRRINGENERNAACSRCADPSSRRRSVVRTEAEGISEDLLIDDLETPAAPVGGIQEAAKSPAHLCCVNRDETSSIASCVTSTSPEVLRVVVDTPAAVARVNASLGADQASLQVEAPRRSSDILEHYRVNAAFAIRSSPG